MSGTQFRQRLAAILAADAAGYSSMMAENERTTVAALDAARAVFRSQIESKQGRVIDMAGDSVLAVFEIATGAVSAALAVQQELGAALSGVPEDRRLRFRIGVQLARSWAETQPYRDPAVLERITADLRSAGLAA